LPNDFPADWSALPFYAVGNATAKSLRSMRDFFGDTVLVPKDVRGGSESGRGDRLARFILDNLPRTGSKKLLYLTGDKNKDTIPRILIDGGLELDSLKVYETHGSPNFLKDLGTVVNSPPGAPSIIYTHYLFISKSARYSI
jgi:uroporphyrinogen-III synthase